MRAARGASPDGFVALTFPDDDALVTTAAAGSDSKAAAGSWSSVLLGDSGAQADVVAEAGADEGGVAAALRRHGHATVALDAADLATLEHAEQKATEFFALPMATKRGCLADATRDGKRAGELSLASCGYTTWPNREHWHVVCGAPDAQPWPSDQVAGFREALLDAAAVLRRVALKELDAFCGGSEAMRELKERCERPGAADPSVIDCFVYRRSVEGHSGGGGGGGRRRRGRRLRAHGVTRRPGRAHDQAPSATPGLEVLDREARVGRRRGDVRARRRRRLRGGAAGARVGRRARGGAASRRDRVARRGPPALVYELRAPEAAAAEAAAARQSRATPSPMAAASLSGAWRCPRRPPTTPPPCPRPT